MASKKVVLVGGWESNPLTKVQARNLAKAFKARKMNVPPVIAKKAGSYRENLTKPKGKGGRLMVKRKKSSEWMKLVKQFGVKGAKQRYKKNYGTHRGGVKAAKKMGKSHYKANAGTKVGARKAKKTGSRWMTLVKRYGVQGAKARYKANAETKVGARKAKKGSSRWMTLVKKYGVQGAKRKYGGKGGYKRNPAGKFLTTYKDLMLHPAKKSDYKGNVGKGIGFGLLGLVDTSLYSAIMQQITKPKEEVKAKAGEELTAFQKGHEALSDTASIITGFLAGTATSYGVGKLTKDMKNAKFHQVGVYTSSILWTIGTIIKHANKAKNGVAMQGFHGTQFTPTAKNIGVELLGFGQIKRSWDDWKILKALRDRHPIQLWKSQKGFGEIKDVTTGKVLVTGGLDGMQRLCGRLSGVNASHFGYQLGEDITVEGQEE